MSQVGLRINEARSLDLDDVKWDLGRFGKLHVRAGKGARGSGPRSLAAWISTLCRSSKYAKNVVGACARASRVPFALWRITLPK
jgi:hypothetical protein